MECLSASVELDQRRHWSAAFCMVPDPSGSRWRCGRSPAPAGNAFFRPLGAQICPDREILFRSGRDDDASRPPIGRPLGAGSTRCRSLAAHHHPSVPSSMTSLPHTPAQQWTPGLSNWLGQPSRRLAFLALCRCPLLPSTGRFHKFILLYAYAFAFQGEDCASNLAQGVGTWEQSILLANF